MKILVMIEAVTTAHTTRSLMIAKSLLSMGHEVIIASTKMDNVLKNETPNEIKCVEISGGLSAQEFGLKLYQGKFPYSVQLLKNYVETDYELLSKYQPDIVFGDFRLSLQISSKLANVTYVNLSNIIWSPYANKSQVVPEAPATRLLKSLGLTIGKKILPMIMKQILKTVNQFRESYGFESLTSLEQFYSQGDYVAYLDSNKLLSTQVLPNNHLFLTPVIFESKQSSAFQIKNNSKRKIFITPGSSGNNSVFKKIIKYLSQSNFEIYVAGVSKESAEINNKKSGSNWPLSNNIHYLGFVNLNSVLPLMDLVIANGGSPMSYLSIKNKKPFLNIPSNMDQHLNSQAFDQINVSRTIRSELINKSYVLNACDDLLNNNEIKNRVFELSFSLEQSDLKISLAGLIQKINSDQKFKHKKNLTTKISEIQFNIQNPT